MYKLLNNLINTSPSTTVLRISDNAYIPFDLANTDYQEYLQWLDEGNTPEEAE
jgi:hypothetical protein